MVVPPHRSAFPKGDFGVVNIRARPLYLQPGCGVLDGTTRGHELFDPPGALGLGLGQSRVGTPPETAAGDEVPPVRCSWILSAAHGVKRLRCASDTEALELMPPALLIPAPRLASAGRLIELRLCGTIPTEAILQMAKPNRIEKGVVDESTRRD